MELIYFAAFVYIKIYAFLLKCYGIDSKQTKNPDRNPTFTNSSGEIVLNAVCFTI
jgi:hypothetical protein